MPRPLKYTPSTCPWAAMVARGLITPLRASRYRRGREVPGRLQLVVMRMYGYDVRVTTGPDGKRRAACARWPERVEVDDGR